MAFTLLETYPPKTAQNTCYFCRAAQRTINGAPERVVDTMIYVDYEGYIVMCESCATEVGIMLGLLPASKATELRERIATLEAENLALKNTASIAEDTITSLTRWNQLAGKETASE